MITLRTDCPQLADPASRKITTWECEEFYLDATVLVMHGANQLESMVYHRNGLNDGWTVAPKPEKLEAVFLVLPRGSRVDVVSRIEAQVQ